MTHPDHFLLGNITKTFGIKGEVVIRMVTNDPQKYKTLQSIWIDENNALKELKIENCRVNKEEAFVKIEAHNTIEQAQYLVKKDVWLHDSMLPAFDEHNFYYHEIIGYEVKDHVKGTIGTIKSILEYPGQDIMQIMNDKTEILIPVTQHWIIKVDRSNKTLEIDTPEGLIDIYTQKPDKNKD